MIKLLLKDTGEYLGEINEADLEMLVDQLEEEDEEDTNYYITAPTIDFLEENGASPELIGILRETLGDLDGVEIAWEETNGEEAE